MKRLILISIFCAVLFSCNFPNPRNETKLKELQQMFSEIPIHENFRLIDSSHSIKDDGAVLSQLYKSSAPYEEVNTFYSTKLAEKEWIFLKEEIFGYTGRKRLIFKKGEYQIFVEYEGKNSGNRFDYGLSLDWSML